MGGADRVDSLGDILGRAEGMQGSGRGGIFNGSAQGRLIVISSTLCNVVRMLPTSCTGVRWPFCQSIELVYLYPCSSFPLSFVLVRWRWCAGAVLGIRGDVGCGSARSCARSRLMKSNSNAAGAKNASLSLKTAKRQAQNHPCHLMSDFPLRQHFHSSGFRFQPSALQPMLPNAPSLQHAVPSTSHGQVKDTQIALVCSSCEGRSIAFPIESLPANKFSW